MLKIFVGWDSREDIAYQVCKYSILKRASIDVEIIPLKQGELRSLGLYKRSTDERASTEFTFTRFFIPYLMGYTGQAVFCDCDFLWQCDAREILDLFNPHYAVQVVKHDYTPKETIKMDNKIQYQYPRKNWSSMILWNCEHPANMKLVPEFLNQAAGSTLHQFKWLENLQIGGLEYQYNYLVNWYHTNDPKIIHYTEGGPWFENYKDTEFADLWTQELREMLES